ncbi:MAG: ribosomal RNA small subunit methyltransferase A [Proteobacteria bacterium]|nr:ribosomal RNA small subunit methyltransferase A [Pseudomonadota bacterium]
MKNVRAKKSLGQNFLVDEGVISRIASAAAIREGEVVVEIGPGRGALTPRLRSQARHLICIEKDDALAEQWERKFAADSGADLVHADALKVLPKDLPVEGPYRVVANLPYNVGGRITMHLLEDWTGQVRSATLMFQKEVAERICASPSTKPYGALSVLVQSFAECWVLFGVPPGAFRPIPKVQSRVIRLQPFEVPKWKEAGLDYEHFRKTVHAGFAARRKTVSNSLSVGLQRESSEILPALAAAEIDASVRPQALGVDAWVRLAGAIE